MKRPKFIKSSCRNCKKSLTMKLEIVKKKKASEMARGQRKFREATSGFGGFPRPKPTPKIKNPIRRQNIMLTCTLCKRSYHYGGLKAKKFTYSN